MHFLYEHYRHHWRHAQEETAKIEGEGSPAAVGSDRKAAVGVESVERELGGNLNGDRVNAKNQLLQAAESLYTAKSQLHLLKRAEQVLAQAQAENDAPTVRAAKAEIKRQMSAHGGWDSFTGSGLVNWLQQGQTEMDCGQTREEAVAIADRLLKLDVIAHVIGKEDGSMLNDDPKQTFLDHADAFYRFEGLREYKKVGEVALRIGWAQARTLEKDELRQELAKMDVAALHKHAMSLDQQRDGGFESKIGDMLDAAEGDTDRKHNGLVELIVKQVLGEPSDVWEPFAWHGSVRTAKPRSRISLAPVLVFGFTTTIAGLVMIFLFSANMSPENTRLWFMTTFWSIVLKIAVLDPVRLVVKTAVLQCVESWSLTRGLIDDKIHKDMVEQAKQKRRSVATETKTDVGLRCLANTFGCRFHRK